MSDEATKPCRIRFICESDNREVIVEAQPGEKLVQAAYRGEVVIQQTCAGKAACTDCKIVVRDGIADGFEPVIGAELRQLGNVFYITHERLACQAIIKGDASVFVPSPQKSRRKEKHRKQ